MFGGLRRSVAGLQRLYQLANHFRTPAMSLSAQAVNASRYLADINPPICGLNVASSFSKLTPEEQRYTHFMSQASWSGARIIMSQWTPYAESLFDLIINTFASKSSLTTPASMSLIKEKSGIPDAEFVFVLEYAAQTLSNLCNYKSFGDTKFIPRCKRSSFEAVVHASERPTAAELWRELADHIYALEPEGHLDIGKPSGGHLSNYYPGSPDITDDEVQAVQALCDAHHLSTLNTRLTKKSATEFTLLVGSADTTLGSDFPRSPLKSDKGLTLHLQGGDFAPQLKKACDALKAAEADCGKDLRKRMLQDYQKSFQTGSIDAHIEGSGKWVEDIGPVVETYIGFIESYVDPYASRAEWEGFTAIVNKELSSKIAVLVDGADRFVKRLPWGQSLERDRFIKPDFTALEIVAFATGGIPAGINIPNYEETRATRGNKNVQLSNILAAKAPNEEITFIHPSERELYKQWDTKAFDVQVALHELLGHGSGKLLQENADGTFNFDREHTINPLTGKPVTSWYKPGETYGSRIPMASSMEECRAESVALYLCAETDILKIFGYESRDDLELLPYMTFLLMARAGVRALEWYDPKTKKHGQAHMQARLGITKWMLDEKIARLDEVRTVDGKLEDAYIIVDRRTVLSKGKETMGRLLNHLQTYRSTGDGKAAGEFYGQLTTPPPSWGEELRELVIRKKQPRKIFCQGNTVLNKDGSVTLKEYPLTNEGVIHSFIERDI